MLPLQRLSLVICPTDWVGLGWLAAVGQATSPVAIGLVGPTTSCNFMITQVLLACLSKHHAELSALTPLAAAPRPRTSRVRHTWKAETFTQVAINRCLLASSSLPPLNSVHTLVWTSRAALRWVRTVTPAPVSTSSWPPITTCHVPVNQRGSAWQALLLHPRGPALDGQLCCGAIGCCNLLAQGHGKEQKKSRVPGRKSMPRLESPVQYLTYQCWPDRQHAHSPFRPARLLRCRMRACQRGNVAYIP